MSCSPQEENARGDSWPASCELMWNQLPWAHHCGIHEASCAWISGEKTPRCSLFSYIFNISAKCQRAEVGRDLLRSPRQDQESRLSGIHIQLGFQHLHGENQVEIHFHRENQALPHWQLLHLFLFSQTRLLRVFCQQESCSWQCRSPPARSRPFGCGSEDASP